MKHLFQIAILLVLLISANATVAQKRQYLEIMSKMEDSIEKNYYPDSLSALPQPTQYYEYVYNDASKEVIGAAYVEGLQEVKDIPSLKQRPQYTYWAADYYENKNYKQRSSVLYRRTFFGSHLSILSYHIGEKHRRGWDERRFVYETGKGYSAIASVPEYSHYTWEEFIVSDTTYNAKPCYALTHIFKKQFVFHEVDRARFERAMQCDTSLTEAKREAWRKRVYSRGNTFTYDTTVHIINRADYALLYYKNKETSEDSGAVRQYVVKEREEKFAKEGELYKPTLYTLVELIVPHLNANDWLPYRAYRYTTKKLINTPPTGVRAKVFAPNNGGPYGYRAVVAPLDTLTPRMLEGWKKFTANY